MGDYFRFGLVFIKKSNQTEFFLKKNQNRTKPINRPVSVRFFREKTVWLGFSSFGSVLARFFRFWLGVFWFWLGFLDFGLVFSGFGSVCSAWLCFGLVFLVWLGFGSVWLGFSSFFRFWFGSVFLVFSVSVQFFRFFSYKTETEPNRPVFSKF
jgi:hypothetical protein